MIGFYIVLTLAVLFVAFMGGVIGYLIGKYWKKKQRMKVRLAKKIMNYYKRFYGSKYWLWRWGYYCGMKSIGKNAGDHRITKAISLTSKKKKNDEE